MTDNEIIKALECCAFWGECTDCPYVDIAYKSSTDNCAYNSTKDALDLINRQKAEIERLNAVSEICGNCHKKYAEKIERAKSEAIKEFAERLKLHSYIVSDESQTGIVCRYSVVTTSQIDTIAEELTVNYESRKDEGK